MGKRKKREDLGITRPAMGLVGGGVILGTGGAVVLGIGGPTAGVAGGGLVTAVVLREGLV